MPTPSKPSPKKPKTRLASKKKLIQSEATALLDLTQEVKQYFDKQALNYSRGTTSFLVASLGGAIGLLCALAFCLRVGSAGWVIATACTTVATIGFTGSLLVYRLRTGSILVEKTYENMARIVDQISMAKSAGAPANVLKALWVQYLVAAALVTQTSQQKDGLPVSQVPTHSQENGRVTLEGETKQLPGGDRPSGTTTKKRIVSTGVEAAVSEPAEGDQDDEVSQAPKQRA